MLTFTFSETLSPRLAAGRKALLDFTPAMRTIADVMRSSAVDRFGTETGPDGAKWKQSKRAQRDGGRTLTDTAHLLGSIVADHDATNSIAGTNWPYAAIHQFGDQGTVAVKAHQRTVTEAFGKKLDQPVTQQVMAFQRQQNMPARPYLGFSPEDIVEIEFLLSEHLDKAFNGGRA